MCATGHHSGDGHNHDSSEDYPLQRQVVRYNSNSQPGNYQSNPIDYN